MKSKAKLTLLLIIPIITLSSCDYEYYTYCAFYEPGSTMESVYYNPPTWFTFDGYFYKLADDEWFKKYSRPSVEEHIGWVYNASTYEIMRDPNETLIEAIDYSNEIFRYYCKEQRCSYEERLYLFTISEHEWDDALVASLGENAIISTYYYNTGVTYCLI